MAKEPPTLGSVERRVEGLEAGIDSLNNLVKSLVDRLDRLTKELEAKPSPKPAPPPPRRKATKVAE